MNFASLVQNPHAGQQLAYLAIRLRSIHVLPQDERGSYAPFIAAQFDRQMDVIRSFHELDGDFAIDLRYLADPEKSNDITIYFLVRLLISPGTPLETQVDNLGGSLCSLLLVHNQLHDFEPVTDSQELSYLFEPFAFNSIVELTKREAIIPLDTLKLQMVRRLGFNGTSISIPGLMNETDSNVYYVFPYSLQMENMERLCSMLSLQDAACLVSMSLRRYHLTEADEENLASRITRCEKYAQLNLASQTDVSSLDPFLKTRSQTLYRNCSLELIQLQDAAYMLKLQIASTSDIRHELITCVGTSITEPPGHPNLPFPQALEQTFSGGYSVHHPLTDPEMEISRKNLRQIDFEPWAPSVAGDNDRHSRYLFGACQAGGVLRLPVPVAGKFPGIDTIMYQVKTPPSDLPDDGIKLGLAKHQNRVRPVLSSRIDRGRHTYVVGQTGTGKSTLFRNMIMQDILAGEGVAVIDPHGELIEGILAAIPSDRAEDVVYINPLDYDRPIGLNMLEKSSFKDLDEKNQKILRVLERDFCVNYLMEIFDELYDLRQTGGPMFEMYMRNALQLLLNQPDEFRSTILDVPRVFQDASYRGKLKKSCSNRLVVDFWDQEAEKAGGESALVNMAPYVTAKLTRFIYNDLMRAIVGQKKSSIDYRALMDEGKILLVDLRKGLLGDTNCRFLGMLIVGKIFSAALSRTNVADKSTLRDFYLYADEFQNLATPTFVSILSEARKYRLSLIITNQYVSQLPEKIRNGIFGNIGTLVSFRVGSDDAPLLSKEFSRIVQENDLMGLPNFHTFTRLLVNGNPSSPFLMKTAWEEWQRNEELAEYIRTLSSLKYGYDRNVVEAEIEKALHLILPINKNEQSYSSSGLIEDAAKQLFDT